MSAFKLVGGIRVLVATALLAAVVWQITDRLIHNLFRPAEYFSYFSIQGTLICAVVLAVTGVRAIRGLSETRLITLTRLSTTVYVVVISVVYNALLRGGAGDIRDAGDERGQEHGQRKAGERPPHRSRPLCRSGGDFVLYGNDGFHHEVLFW